MAAKRIFVTGASGCIGHYITEVLIQQTGHELFLLVRNPAKLQIDCAARSGVTVVQGDMRDIERFSRLLKTMDAAILTAAAWGGTQEAFDINVVKTVRLMNLLDPEVCEQVIYFSTASILGRDNQPLKEAGQIGTDYIKSKYSCFQQLPRLAIAPKITTVFPTLVFGGDRTKPYSHLSGGIAEVTKWINLIRFLKADGSFHFIHGQDIAHVVAYLIDHPPDLGASRRLVLGNAPLTVDRAVEEACRYLRKRIYFRIPVSFQLANFLIVLFRIQMAAWDYFCLNYRHFTYENPVNPTTYELSPYCSTMAELLQASGVSSPVKHSARLI
jgi:nucleoside-diphosphate-sugar epimerase